MKRSSCHALLLSLLIATTLCAQQGFNSFTEGSFGCLPKSMPDDFGITHFIVGFPHENVKVPVQKYQKPRAACSTKKRALFSPDDDLQQALIELINNEQESIKIAIFSFTDKDIAQALIDAHKRGVHVEVVTDPAQLKDRYSKVCVLLDEGIIVHEYDPNYVKDKRSNLMHHKFVVFGNNASEAACVWTGSFNFTVAARQRNQENAVVDNDKDLVVLFLEQFDRLKQRCIGTTKPRRYACCNRSAAGRVA